MLRGPPVPIRTSGQVDEPTGSTLVAAFSTPMIRGSAASSAASAAQCSNPVVANLLQCRDNAAVFLYRSSGPAEATEQPCGRAADAGRES